MEHQFTVAEMPRMIPLGGIGEMPRLAPTAPLKLCPFRNVFDTRKADAQITYLGVAFFLSIFNALFGMCHVCANRGAC